MNSPFNKIYKEHIQALRHPEKSKLAKAQANYDHSHSNNNENIQILHKCKKDNFTNGIEEYYIYENELE